MQDGFGIETWNDDSKYEGQFSLGKKEGQGTYIWFDGSKYKGTWKDNKISGYVHKHFFISFFLGGLYLVRWKKIWRRMAW